MRNLSFPLLVPWPVRSDHTTTDTKGRFLRGGIRTVGIRRRSKIARPGCGSPTTTVSFADREERGGKEIGETPFALPVIVVAGAADAQWKKRKRSGTKVTIPPLPVPPCCRYSTTYCGGTFGQRPPPLPPTETTTTTAATCGD